MGSSQLIECRFWAADRHVLQAPTAPRTPELLVIGTVHDPATPYEGSIDLTETLGNATLLTWEGDGHTAYGQSECINCLVLLGIHHAAYALEATLIDDDRIPALHEDVEGRRIVVSTGRDNAPARSSYEQLGSCTCETMKSSPDCG